MDFETPKPELAPDLLEPPAVAPRKLPLRAVLETADCNDDETHEHFPATWNPVCRRKCSRSIICAHECVLARNHARSRFSSASAQSVFTAAGLCVHNRSRL